MRAFYRMLYPRTMQTFICSQRSRRDNGQNLAEVNPCVMSMVRNLYIQIIKLRPYSRTEWYLERYLQKPFRINKIQTPTYLTRRNIKF